MPNYQDGKIYTFQCNTDTSLIYVGSTTKPLWYTKSIHKRYSRVYPNYPLYTVMANNGGWYNWYIKLIESFPCNSKSELEKRKGEIMREIGSLNLKLPPYLTMENNPEYQKEYDKEYREKNKIRIQKQKEELAKKIQKQKEELAKHLENEKHKSFIINFSD